MICDIIDISLKFHVGHGDPDVPPIIIGVKSNSRRAGASRPTIIFRALFFLM